MSCSGALACPGYRHSVRLAWRVLFASGIGLTSVSAFAYWEVIPHVEAGLTWEENPRYIDESAKAALEILAPGITDDATGTFIDTRLYGSYQTPSNEIQLSPRIRKSDYLKSNKDLNDDTWAIDFLATHEDQRGSVSVSASYRETGVRTSEYESATPENPNAPPEASGGSGRYTGDDTQTTRDVRPSLTYNLSTRNTVELSFSAADVAYEQPVNSGLPDEFLLTGSYFDYTSTRTALAINHYLNNKNFLQVSLNGGGFESSQPNEAFRNSTDSFGVNAAYNLAITPTLSANARIGTSRSSVDVVGLQFDPLTGAFCPPDALCSASDDDRNFVGDIGLRKRSELTTLNFNVSRSLAPSSNGTEVVQDQFRFFVERTVTQRLRVSAASIYIEETAVAATARRDRTYLTIDGTLSWRLTPTLSAYGMYSYISNEYNVTTSSSTDINHRLYFGFTYRGVGFRR